MLWKRGRSPARIVPVAPVLASLALVGAFACDAESVPEGPGRGAQETVVELVVVEPQLLANVVDIPGQLAAGMTVDIHPEVDGIIESIEFREGDTVEKGQVLFRLRDHRQRALLAEAEAEAALARATHKRTLNLAGRAISSEAQLEKAAAELSIAKARVEAAAVDVERTVVRAPFEGVVGALPVAPGDRVRTRSTMLRIDVIDRLQLLFYLPGRAVGVVKPGIPVQIRVAAWPGDAFGGEVYFVSPTLEAEGRRVLIKAWIPNPDLRLRPGMFAEIEAEVSRREDALLVPESALFHELDGTYVWRVDEEQRARRVPVQVGLRREGEVEIADGLASGDIVVSAGVHKVRAGGRVRAAAGVAASGRVEEAPVSSAGATEPASPPSVPSPARKAGSGES